MTMWCAAVQHDAGLLLAQPHVFYLFAKFSFIEEHFVQMVTE